MYECGCHNCKYDGQNFLCPETVCGKCLTENGRSSAQGMIPSRWKPKEKKT